jgi:membrane protease subunit HflC
MRIGLLATVALLIVAGFVVYMCSYTVKFTDAAVITTFGKAGAEDVITTPGLRFKWPAPIQQTTVYDTRARFLSTRLETQQTADNRQIVAESFMTWRVTDPLAFYQRFRGSGGASAREHYTKAEETLVSLLRSAMTQVSQYNLTDLLSIEPGASKMAQLEGDVLARLRDEKGGNVKQYGVEVVMVGISSLTLPKDVTADVFTRMGEGRKRLAAKAESEGQAVATAIKSEAESAAKRIREFAKFRADQIRNRGELEAARYLTALNEDPELATFLQGIEGMREGIGRQATFVLPTSLFGLNYFTPEAMEKVRRGEIPSMNQGMLDAAKSAQPAQAAPGAGGAR